jgi:hypothetical protein
VAKRSNPTASGTASVANGVGARGTVAAITKSANGGANSKGAGMSTHPFNNEVSQKERRELIRNNTYHGKAQLDEALDASEAVMTPSYPRLPRNSPWHSDPVPDEPPLGIAIDDLHGDNQ